MTAQHHDPNDTQYYHLIEPPCMWARVLVWALGLSGAIAVFVYGLQAGQIDKIVKASAADQVIMQQHSMAISNAAVDMKYIRESLVEIKATLKEQAKK